jgi:hypothetical protein
MTEFLDVPGGRIACDVTGGGPDSAAALSRHGPIQISEGIRKMTS